MAENIDRARLVAILDAGKDAQSRALALGQESQEIREAVRLAKLTAEASRRTVTAKGGQVHVQPRVIIYRDGVIRYS